MQYVLTGNPGSVAGISRYKRAGYDVDEKSKTSYSGHGDCRSEGVVKPLEAETYSGKAANQQMWAVALLLHRCSDLREPEDFLQALNPRAPKRQSSSFHTNEQGLSRGQRGSPVFAV